MVDPDISGEDCVSGLDETSDEDPLMVDMGNCGVPAVVIENVSNVDIDGTTKCVEDSDRGGDVACCGAERLLCAEMATELDVTAVSDSVTVLSDRVATLDPADVIKTGLIVANKVVTSETTGDIDPISLLAINVDDKTPVEDHTMTAFTDNSETDNVDDAVIGIPDDSFSE